MMAEKNGALAADVAGAACAAPELTLERVNVAPAQTWNRLRTNDITLTVPAHSRKGDVYFSLPRLFEGVECGMGAARSARSRSWLPWARATSPTPA